MTKEEAKVLLTGARRHFDPVRGMGYVMGDGSWLSEIAYKELRLAYLFASMGTNKEVLWNKK